MDMNKTSGMAFREAWFAMLNGKRLSCRRGLDTGLSKTGRS